ncbi:MAG TPA: hypothetical protein VK206_09985, partial [Anaerolineales bacterium]|nr:hypothetical protein [Anaerolineales bacterium]
FEKIVALPDIEQFPLLYAKMLINSASWEWLQGKFTEANSHLSKARSLCMELGAEGEPELAWALTWLGIVARMETIDLAKATSFAEEAVQLHQKWGDQTGEAFSTMTLGMIQKDLRLPIAEQTLEHSLELYTQLQDPWGIARVAQNLGLLHLQNEDFEKAQKYLEQHLFLDKELDFKMGIGAALAGLADMSRVRGDYAQAEQYYQQGIQIAHEYGTDPSYSIGGLAMTALGQKDYELARKRFTELFQRTREETEKVSVCDFLMGLAAVSAGLDQPERAAKLYGAVQTILDTVDYRYPGNDRSEFERHIQLAREQLKERFEMYVEEGRSMTMEQAVEYALEETDG